MVYKDPSSAANVSDVIIRHINLIWNVSFDHDCVSGTATYDVEFFNEVDTIILDSNDLSIKNVKSACNAAFAIEDNKPFGQKIVVKFGRCYAKNEKYQFSITYETSSSAYALQFVRQEFTEDKVAPFLYSQCQPIYARSIVPCQDTPLVKQTYSASVSVPSNLTCLMSALSKGNTESIEQGTRTFEFEQPIAIPSYLFAFVVGRLERREISDRCAIWSEPSIADAAKSEFIDTEKMLHIAENLMGKYVWTRYDMVLLPPFFPYGGMENPMLTFIPRTLIAGDRSMIDVVAHEICHSWTGNLVTNANWECFWLNEGFTKFMENKIMGVLYGEKFRQFLSYTDWHDVLYSTVHDVFSPTHEYTKLSLNLSGIDPDDAFSSIPYVKGAAFLFLLEQRLGGPSIFEKFLRSYIEKFSQRSVTVDDFIGYLREYFKDKEDVLNAISIDKWLNDPGMPPEIPEFDDTLVSKCKELAEKWSVTSVEKLRDADLSAFLHMTPDEQISVLTILDNKPNLLSTDKIAIMEEKYKIMDLKNADVLNVWIALALRNHYHPVIPHALEFTRKYGRMKYLKPIYRRLFAWEKTRDAAITQFQSIRGMMHPISANCVNALLPAAT